MLINMLRLREVTERLKPKVYDKVMCIFLNTFFEKGHIGFASIHIKFIFLVLTKHLTKLQHEASISGQKSGLKTA